MKTLEKEVIPIDPSKITFGNRFNYTKPKRFTLILFDTRRVERTPAFSDRAYLMEVSFGNGSIHHRQFRSWRSNSLTVAKRKYLLVSTALKRGDYVLYVERYRPPSSICLTLEDIPLQ